MAEVAEDDGGGGEEEVVVMEEAEAVAVMVEHSPLSN